MSQLEYINSLLEQMGNVNNGANHGSDYSLDELPAADSMTVALETYFSYLSTSNSPSQPPGRWNIRTEQMDDASSIVADAARHWFYELEFSPAVDDATSDKTLGDFIRNLSSIVDMSSAVQVKVDPPMWYECTWQDFAFESDVGRWLLHFGFSD